tara:strand:- start:84867 stop:85916 length:1050 start_codon:yes stop_codon:yes gene_type:complete
VKSDENKANQVVVTNIIDEIKVKGVTTFQDTVDNITITYTPVDTRLFQTEMINTRNFDGHHRNILSFTNELKAEENTTSNELNLLTKKLSEEGFTIEAIEFIRDIIANEAEAKGETYIYTNPNIYFTDLAGVNPLNPFTFDGRYLTVVEVKLINQSDIYRRVCASDFVVTGGDEVYRHIPSDVLISGVQVGSIRYEALHKLLMDECENIPGNTQYKTYLAFPTFYSQGQLSFHFKNKNVSLSNDIQIEKNRFRNDYIFTKAKIDGSNKGYRELSEGRTVGTKSGDFYHFLKLGKGLKYIGFKNFLVHSELDLSEIEIVSIEIEGEKEEVSIKRNGLTKEDLNNGVISID